jgi:hypothetical protein
MDRRIYVDQLIDSWTEEPLGGHTDKQVHWPVDLQLRRFIDTLSDVGACRHLRMRATGPLRVAFEKKWKSICSLRRACLCAWHHSPSTRWIFVNRLYWGILLTKLSLKSDKKIGHFTQSSKCSSRSKRRSRRHTYGDRLTCTVEWNIRFKFISSFIYFHKRNSDKNWLVNWYSHLLVL